MALTLGPGATGDKLAAKQDVGTDVVYEINGDLRTISGSTDAYGSLAQGALGTSAAALVGPAAGTDMIVDSITLSNPGASTRVVTFYKTRNSVTYDATTQWGSAITLLTGESAHWNGVWTVYTSTGLIKTQPSGMILPSEGFGGAVTGYAADTYLVGSKILLPTSLLVAGRTQFRWNFGVSKTAACTGTPTVIIRYGTAGAIGDTARVTFTFSAQSAAVDRGWVEVIARFRSVGSGTSAVLDAEAFFSHQLATTGLNSTVTGGQELAVTSGGFDSTPAGSYIGLSVNGTSTTAPAVWTTTAVYGVAIL